MELMSEDLHPVFLPLDVDSEESIQAAKEAIETSFGRLDLLINNAGVLYRVGSHGEDLGTTAVLVVEVVCSIKDLLVSVHKLMCIV